MASLASARALAGKWYFARKYGARLGSFWLGLYPTKANRAFLSGSRALARRWSMFGLGLSSWSSSNRLSVVRAMPVICSRFRKDKPARSRAWLTNPPSVTGADDCVSSMYWFLRLLFQFYSMCPFYGTVECTAFLWISHCRH